MAMLSTIQLSEGKERHLSLLLFLILLVPADFLTGFIVAWRNGYYTNINPILATNIVTNKEAFRTQDRFCHHNLAARASTIEQWGDQRYANVTNSLGFKAGESSLVPLASSKHRILFIGDSFTEGVGIEYDKTFVGIIGKALASRNIEVLNAGVMGYCPKLEFYKILHLIDDLGVHFDECVVFIDLSDVCDEIMYSSFVPANKVAADDYTGRYTFVPNLLRWHEYSIIYRNVAKLMGKDPSKRFRIFDNQTNNYSDFWTFKSEWSSDARAFEKQGRPGLESCTYYIELLRELCLSHGIKMSIAVYPWPKEIELRNRRAIPRAHWHQYAVKNNLPLYDFFPLFDNGDAPRTTIDKYYIPKDVHWNAQGHTLIAKAWLEQYTSHTEEFRQSNSTR